MEHLQRLPGDIVLNMLGVWRFQNRHEVFFTSTNITFRSRNWDYCRRDPSRWPRGTLYPQKLALTSPTSGGHSVGIVRSRTEATEFFLTNITLRTTRIFVRNDCISVRLEHRAVDCIAACSEHQAILSIVKSASKTKPAKPECSE
jgi:hypothetical protein